LTSRALLEKLFSNWIVKILSVAAAVVLFIFQRIGSLDERFFSVPLRYDVDESYVVTDLSVGSVRINVRGAEEEIFLVLEDDIEAYLDLTAHRSEGIFKSPVLLRRTGSAETVHVEMSVEPLEATVTTEQRISRELEIVPQLSGYPAVGYELVQHLTTPEVVAVSGPRSRIESLDRLQTTVVDLDGRNTDFSVRVAVEIKDDMVALIGSSIVEVHGIIREIIIRRTFEAVEIRYVNLLPSLSVAVHEDLGSLRLSGPQLVLESLRADDFLLEVDCGEITEPGLFELKVVPEVPGQVSVVSFQPAATSISVETREPPAASPDETGDGSGETGGESESSTLEGGE
jgi:YbbR domain-containing protein